MDEAGDRVARAQFGSPEGSQARWLWFFLTMGLALRFVVVLGYPLIHHPDEVFNYLEQSHRLATGDGLVPWEYRAGIRSWILPGALVPLKWLADWIGDDPRIFTRAAWGAMSILSMTIVWAGTQWTSRHHGRFAAALVGTLLAFSPLMLLYSPRVLTEVAATNFLFLALMGPTAWAALPTRRRFFLVGLCLGLSFVLRFHIAGAVALLGIYLCGRELRERWLPALLGAGSVVVASGLLDWATWDYPFQTILRSYQMNIVEGVAASFGTTSLLDWTSRLGLGQLWFFPLLAFAAGLLFLGRSKNAGFLLLAVGVALPLTFVGHKEVRHFYPAMPAVLLLWGVGLARAIEWMRSSPVPKRWAYAATAIGLLASVALSFFGPLEKHFQRGRPFIDAALMLHQRSDLCGLAIIDTAFADTAGHSFLNRSVPFYILTAQEDRDISERPYNYALVRPEDRAEFADYATIRCWEGDDIFWRKDRVCLLATQQSCGDALPEYEANHRIRERGL